MEITSLKIILANLVERIELGDDGKYRFSGIITPKEYEALNYLISDLNSSNGSTANDVEDLISKANILGQEVLKEFNQEHHLNDNPSNKQIELDLSSLSLPEPASTMRVCMDFGTAMSKATFVDDGEDDSYEDIRVLNLGIPGDQEQVDPIMLVSSVYIDQDAKIWFGQHAVEQAEAATESSTSRIDNIKRALSEDNLDELLSNDYNPTSLDLSYQDIVLSYLMFFTWAINHSLANDFGDEIPRNIKRRFAMPCFPRPNARKVEAKLKTMLGEAQVLADTFNDIMHDGVPLHDFLIALKKLRSEKRTYSFIDCSVTEPLGVAGSLLSWNNNSNSLVLVVDIGAGTSDFSLYRLKVDIVDDHTVRSTAGEVDGTARGISEAGNHLDKILMGLILRKSGINTNNPRYRNVTHALERDIRNYKESLFSPTAEATITLYNGDPVDVTLEEFLAEPAVKSFERSLRETMVNILESAHEDWVNWVRAHPSRRLTIVLTGGGSTLPMVRKLAEGTVTAHGITIPVAAAKSFPEWLRDDFPDLEEHYPRVAVSLGGARKHTIQSMGVLKSTGISGEREYKLERFVTRGV